MIRARVLPANNELANPSNLPNQSLLSSNRFEENRTYTICGAIDLRTGKKLTLSQAIKEGVIDSKSGTYVNLNTGETLSINKAIDASLVLTEVGEPENQALKAAPLQLEPQRDIRTLNIEFVKDLRNDGYNETVGLTELLLKIQLEMLIGVFFFLLWGFFFV